MLKMTALSVVLRKNRRLSSFSLIELLMVIAIIAILAALTLAAASAVMNKGARSRASAEIQAMGTALEGYKTDNGIYPTASGLLTNSAAAPYHSTTLDGTSTAYQTNSQTLYMALSGKTNFLDLPAAGVKSYMSFKMNQVGNATTAAGTAPSASTSTYVKDPWGYSYGYSTGTTNNATTVSYPFNGSGFFDLWSTGGLINGAQANTNAWLSNWQ
jgi:prepilin-type N-terminal cleavage/methylation domain-containing protein